MRTEHNTRSIGSKLTLKNVIHTHLLLRVLLVVLAISWKTSWPIFAEASIPTSSMASLEMSTRPPNSPGSILTHNPPWRISDTNAQTNVKQVRSNKGLSGINTCCNSTNIHDTTITDSFNNGSRNKTEQLGPEVELTTNVMGISNSPRSHQKQKRDVLSIHFPRSSRQSHIPVDPGAAKYPHSFQQRQGNTSLNPWPDARQTDTSAAFLPKKLGRASDNLTMMARFITSLNAEHPTFYKTRHHRSANVRKRTDSSYPQTPILPTYRPSRREVNNNVPNYSYSYRQQNSSNVRIFNPINLRQFNNAVQANPKRAIQSRDRSQQIQHGQRHQQSKSAFDEVRTSSFRNSPNRNHKNSGTNYQTARRETQSLKSRQFNPSIRIKESRNQKHRPRQSYGQRQSQTYWPNRQVTDKPRISQHIGKNNYNVMTTPSRPFPSNRISTSRKKVIPSLRNTNLGKTRRPPYQSGQRTRQNVNRNQQNKLPKQNNYFSRRQKGHAQETPKLHRRQQQTSSSQNKNVGNNQRVPNRHKKISTSPQPQLAVPTVQSIYSSRHKQRGYPQRKSSLPRQREFQQQIPRQQILRPTEIPFRAPRYRSRHGNHTSHQNRRVKGQNDRSLIGPTRDYRTGTKGGHAKKNSFIQNRPRISGSLNQRRNGRSQKDSVPSLHGRDVNQPRKSSYTNNRVRYNEHLKTLQNSNWKQRYDSLDTLTNLDLNQRGDAKKIDDVINLKPSVLEHSKLLESYRKYQRENRVVEQHKIDLNELYYDASDDERLVPDWGQTDPPSSPNTYYSETTPETTTVTTPPPTTPTPPPTTTTTTTTTTTRTTTMTTATTLNTLRRTPSLLSRVTTPTRKLTKNIPDRQGTGYNDHCGILGSPFIIGGRRSREGRWPWQASLQIITSSVPWHRCGGVLIHPKWILTAAHCLEGPFYGRLENWRIVMADHDLDIVSGKEIYRSIARVISHPDYRRASNFPNDVALLEMDRPVDMTTGDVRTACLPHREMDVEEGARCWISGWGETRDHVTKTNTMNEMPVEIVELNKCKAMWNRVDIHVLDSQVCVGYGETGACYGDSGGPLMCEQDGRFYVTGVMSWLITNCSAPDFPNVFTRLPYFMDWVHEQQLDF